VPEKAATNETMQCTGLKTFHNQREKMRITGATGTADPGIPVLYNLFLLLAAGSCPCIFNKITPIFNGVFTFNEVLR
jgi:hypothetical protein